MEPTDTTASADAIRWHIGSLGPKPDATEDVLFNAAVPISADEATEISSAINLMMSSTAEHPLNDLRREAVRVAERVAAWPDTGMTPGAVSELQQVMLDWLTRLRAFHDHSLRRLTRYYGRASPELLVFKAACSAEYDGVFEYRFAWKLRNYVQHVGHAVQHMSTRVSGVADSVQAEVDFDATILLQDYDEWGHHVRSDLHAIAGRFPVIGVVAAVMQACDRIVSKELLAQEPRLRNACEVLRIAISRAPQSGTPYLIGLPPSEAMPNRVGEAEVRLSPLPVALPHLVELALSESARVLQVPLA